MTIKQTAQAAVNAPPLEVEVSNSVVTKLSQKRTLQG